MAQTIAKRFEAESERVERARAEFNFHSVELHIPRGARVLDVGAWSCYLGEMLRDRLGCDVLSLDVLDANKTDMPFRVFDGKNLPVDSGSFDVVLLLYVLHHAVEDAPLLNEARRVLRDGGRLVVAEDSVDGLWNRILTVGFHVWLYVITRMGCDGEFRKRDEWRQRFGRAGFQVKDYSWLGHHMGRKMWPNNLLFVLEKQ